MYAKTDEPPKTRLAITEDMLQEIILSRKSEEQGYKKILFIALFSTMYHGPLICSEVTYHPKLNHNLEAKQITLINMSHMEIAFTSYKHSKPPTLIKAS